VSRTIRAALVGAVIGFASVTGLGVFLGFSAPGSVVAGVITGLLAGLLLWGAARRADTFHAVDEIPPVTPRFPGPPEPREDPDRDD
jgi:hypothetical protein